MPCLLSDATCRRPCLSWAETEKLWVAGVWARPVTRSRGVALASPSVVLPTRSKARGCTQYAFLSTRGRTSHRPWVASMKVAESRRMSVPPHACADSRSRQLLPDIDWRARQCMLIVTESKPVSVSTASASLATHWIHGALSTRRPRVCGYLPFCWPFLHIEKMCRISKQEGRGPASTTCPVVHRPTASARHRTRT
ncbi:hypothetical protein PHLGIDRAFT_441913 [Phlebiopsis gigantea 11061_1 CR5-6]|uniref:Uncharacterized protein n=1 Tax=Phlebiopsis gigantea (strain 11061_1 CR5-6) TaxID=745531 RepID=A0A0C3RY42_PHLG1|nr:hypothetical protein PHLGIDRAFT_441913 [Phlebiopsis gigantea 11061_1 CR5-6]